MLRFIDAVRLMRGTDWSEDGRVRHVQSVILEWVGRSIQHLTEFAKRLRESRVALARVVNGRAAVGAELATRLADALDGSAEPRLHMQATYDLWHAQKKKRPMIQRLTSTQRERPVHALGPRVMGAIKIVSRCTGRQLVAGTTS